MHKHISFTEKVRIFNQIRIGVSAVLTGIMLRSSCCFLVIKETVSIDLLVGRYVYRTCLQAADSPH